MGTSSRDRQAAFRVRQRELGLVPVTVFVHENQAANLRQAAAELVVNGHHFEVAMFRDTFSGKFRKLGR